MAEIICEKCGKKFESDSSLVQHMHNKHGFKNIAPSDRPRKVRTKTIATWSVIVILVVLVGSFLIFSPKNSNEGKVGSIVEQDVYGKLNVSFDVLNSIGNNNVQGLRLVAGSPLTQDNKPKIVYVGAEYCPYCAAERWSMIIALSKFGNFTGLEYTLSSSNDVYPNTPTFTFTHASYTSDYISFEAVETHDRNNNLLQSPTAEQNTLMRLYNPSGGIPFLDIGNKYVLVGSQINPGTISGDWNAVLLSLNDTNSQTSRNINGAANVLISAICKVTNSQPADVCSQPAAKLLIG
ncbi:MAG: DUF929 family protein [Candidatus Aenigmarchaeota archaeon]|nr:DUF929 family protein [Candidatus Aenigmarchaeota archaeon]